MMSADREDGEERPAASSQTLTDPHDILTNATELEPDAHEGEVKRDTTYLSKVTNVVEYGVFVSLTPSYGSDITGLVHQTNLPPSTDPGEYEPGDRIVVELGERKEDGDLAFLGLYSPDADGSGPDMVDLQRSLADIREDVEALRDREDRPALSEGQPLESQGIPAALAKLKRLAGAGYGMESFATDAREGGDVVELNLTVSKSETDD